MGNHDYIKLRGKGFKRGSFLSLSGIRASLWMGKDHVLCIYNKGYEEDYKRFYYRDVQAIVTHQDNRRLIWNILFGFCAFLFALWGMPFLTVSGFFLLLILINVLLGPTCTCYLKTAVSREILPSLNRLRNVNHAIAQLSRVIEREQGQVSLEEIRRNIRENGHDGTGKGSGKTAEAGMGKAGYTPESGRQRVPNSYGGTIHTYMFYALIISALLTSLDFFHKTVLLTTIQMIWSSGLSVLMITALVKQQGSSLSRWIKRLTWTTLGFMCAVSLIGYCVVVFMTFQTKAAMYTTWDYMKMLSSVSPYDNFFLMVVYVVSVSYCVTAGIAGMALMSSHKNR